MIVVEKYTHEATKFFKNIQKTSKAPLKFLTKIQFEKFHSKTKHNTQKNPRIRKRRYKTFRQQTKIFIVVGEISVSCVSQTDI